MRTVFQLSMDSHFCNDGNQPKPPIFIGVFLELRGTLGNFGNERLFLLGKRICTNDSCIWRYHDRTSVGELHDDGIKDEDKGVAESSQGKGHLFLLHMYCMTLSSSVWVSCCSSGVCW